MKRVATFLFLFQFLFAFSISAQTPEIASGLNYLNSIKNPDGSWGNDITTTEILPTTVSVIETLQVLNQTGTTNYSNAILWLQSQSLYTTDYLSARIYALSVAGTDQGLLLTYLDELVYAWGGYDDHEANNLDTSLALLALKKTNYQDQNTVSYALGYLIGNQNTDGGFGFYQGDESSVYMTSMVLNTLSQFNDIYNLQEEIDNAIAYLLTKQNPDGGFGTSPSTVYETALALIALIESGQGGAAFQNAINYLMSTQLPNGSWNDDPYSTALALRALANVKPNLSISSNDIIFSNPTPTVGETITITATIHNEGPAGAENVSVQFYDGDPSAGGVLIGETTIQSIPAFGSTQGIINWTIPTASDYTMFVKLDSQDFIDELDETDNLAQKKIYAGSGPDLNVSDIISSPEIAIIGQPVTMTFTVNNLGETPANNILVEYYQAEDTIGGIYPGNKVPGQYTKIGETIVPELVPGMSYTGQIVRNFTEGWHNIKVVVDPLNAIEETNESDNELSYWIAALPEQVDLILNNDIIVVPNNPKENDAIAIHALAFNYGSVTANAVVVSLYDGDPLSSGIKIGEQILDMPPIDPKQLEFHVSLTYGVHDIYVVLDLENSVIEANETNNQAMKSIVVDMASDVDFSIAESDITFTPSSALPGDNITITAAVHNLGPTTESTSVSFYIGNPSYGGSKIKDENITVPGNSVINVPVVYTVGDKPATVFIMLDEADSVYEKSEKNNKAYKKLSIQLPDLMVRDKDIKINRMSNGSIFISPLIRNLGGLDATNVTVFLYDGDPAAGGRLISNQVVDLISSNSGKRINVPYTLAKERHDLYVIADPDNQIEEITEANNSGMKVVYEMDPDGPDITVTAVDASGVTTDTQSLIVNGILNGSVTNLSDISITVPFHVTAYEDMNKNSFYDSEADNKLGEIVISTGLDAHQTSNFSINISGHISFRDNHIHVMADSSDTITEKDEENNNRHHKEGCSYIPGQGFEVVEKLTWMGGDYEPIKNKVYMSPVVANMNDDNGDGIIDENDIPDIIFVSGGFSFVDAGVLRVISGKDGEEIFSVTRPDPSGIHPYNNIAIGDIDNDGDPEIIVSLMHRTLTSQFFLVAYNHDGTVLWTSDTSIGNAMATPFIADLDNNGEPEIMMGLFLFNNKGQLLWNKTGLYRALIPIAVDLNNDDKMEIVLSKYAYNLDGTVHWVNSLVNTLGMNAIGNFDADSNPEVVVSGVGKIYLLEHDKTIKWGGEYALFDSAPSVGDVAGDGSPEIAGQGNWKFFMVNSDGTIRWEAPVYDSSGGQISPVFFDLNGDGKAEVAVNDQRNLFIFNGDTGEILFETPNPSLTFYEVLPAADVDNDGHVELIYAGQQRGSSEPYRGGIRVFGEKNGNWVNSRRIWNQHSYHVTNIDEDGYIPLREENSWEKYNCYRCNVPIKNVHDAPDLTASKISIDQTIYPEYVKITARIGNAGTLLTKEGIKVSFYNGNPDNGGILLGTVTISRHLNPEEYTDIDFLWYYPAEGTHDIYVVADPDGKIKECDEANNVDSVQVVIGETDIPDLVLSQSDVVIIPPEVVEGQDASIGATVHNNANADTYSIEIKFYDGDAETGTLIGTANIPFIQSGGTSYLQLPWNTFGQSGRNYIHIVADPQNLIQESNENNNSALIPVDVTPPAKPDLTVTSTDIEFSNQAPREGDPLTITATIHNLGTQADSIKVNLYDGVPESGGTFLGTTTIYQIIPFGGQVQVTFAIDTVGFSGNHAFYVVTDPDNTIEELREDNNRTSADLLIGSIGLNLTESTNKVQYKENEDVQIAVNITDLQNEVRELLVDIKVFDSAGFLTASLNAFPLTLNPLETRTLGFLWNTGDTLIGNYSMRATVYDTGSNPLARQSVPISIISSQGISTNLVLDKTSYYPNESSKISSIVSNNSANKIFEDLAATVTIKNTSGQALVTENTPINILTPSSFYSFNSYWNTSINPPGEYPVTLEVKDLSGTVLSTSTKVLTISSEVKPTKVLRGQISVDKNSLLQGEPVAITYSVTNIGNIDLAQIDLSVLTVHVVTLAIHDTLTDQTGLQMGGTYTNTQQLNTQNYSAKDYLVILRANVSGIEETLAGTYFRVEGAPSSPSLYLPAHGDDVETYTPALTVNNASDPNDDDLTYEFELYSDIGLTTLLASSGTIEEGSSITSWQVPLELQENAVYFWRARAYDGLLYGEWMVPASFRVNLVNEPPAAPTLSSPADNSEVDTLTPILIVNNASDPDSSNLTYNFELSLDSGFTQIVSSQIGIFEGEGITSWQVPISLNENTSYYWRAQADDWFIEGPWMSPARFFINTANDAPTAPSIISPLNNSKITTLYADIVASNSTDPDSPTLTYVFEIDTVITFDSPTIISSGNIPEGQGTTSWHLEGLSDNTYYYVRAKASDGLAESPWSEVIGFFVNTTNDAPTIPVLANPSDGAGVNVFNPTLSVHNSSDIDGDVLAYEFEIYGDASMTNLVAQVTGVEETPQVTSWTVPINLVENNTYYWRARAFDGELHSGWMSPASFMVNTANDAPSAPTLNSPSEGSSIDTLYPTLSIYNSSDPDSDSLTYDFEIYSNGILIQSITGIPQNISGITSVTLSTALSDNTTYTWRARAYDGDRYSAWMDMATFSIHLPITNITATIDFDPNTLNKKSNGKWVVVYIELPSGYNVADIIISSIFFEGTIPAEPWPYDIGDYDSDGIPDLMVKFRRSEVINVLPTGDNVLVHVTGTVGTVTFEGVDTIRVIN